MLVDLHVHWGAGCVAPATILESAPGVGVDGVAFIGELAFPDVRALRDGPLGVYGGAEVPTDRGHYLVFLPEPWELPGMEVLFGPAQGGVWHVRDVVSRTRALGGAVIAAHPYDANLPNGGGDILFTLQGLSAVEVMNARHGGLSIPAVEAAETLGIACTGGSDTRSSLDPFGLAGTLFSRRIVDEQDLVHALRSGHCWPVECGTPPPPDTSRPPQIHSDGAPGQSTRDGEFHRRRRRGR